nr:LacI family DNA-binding transcriptional regulator [Rubricella aquisinus]
MKFVSAYISQSKRLHFPYPSGQFRVPCPKIPKRNETGVKRQPTIQDVATLANVSTATVSRALNSPDRVRETTRDAVQQAVQALGYTPDFGGQALASGRTNTIGAVIPTMDNAIFARALQSLQEELTTMGVTLLVATSQYDPEREEQQVRALLSRGVDGLILIGQARAARVYELLEGRAVPYALLWTTAPSGQQLSIGFDNSAAAAKLVTQALQLGHRRFAMIAGITKGNDRARARVDGVRATLADAGLTLEPPYLVEGSYDIEQTVGIARALISLPEPPTVILCGNDVQAAGVLKAVRQAGLSVPRDVSVLGFDDIELATAVDPALTTIRVPHRRMGRMAAHLLIGWIKTGQRPDSVQFDTDLIWRASLGPPPA